MRDNVQRRTGRGKEGKHRYESSKEGERRVPRLNEKMRKDGNNGIATRNREKGKAKNNEMK
jgi:hypothetical protein